MSNPASSPVKAYGLVLRTIERIGQTCLTVYVAVLIAVGIVWPEPYADVWQLILGQMVAGRAFSVSHGLNQGFHPLFLLFQCTMLDILMLLLLYPLIVAGYRRAVEWPLLRSTIDNIQATAHRHRSKVEPFGAIGLIAFVFFPFWSTGALAGGVLGYLIGMRTAVTFTAVIIGDTLAVASWIWLFDQMLLFSETLGKRLPWIILVTVLLTAAVFRAWHLRHRLGDLMGNHRGEPGDKDSSNDKKRA